MKRVASRLSLALAFICAGCDSGVTITSNGSNAPVLMDDPGAPGSPEISAVFSREVDQDLVEAAVRGDTDGVDAALAAGADVNAIGGKGITPLDLVYYEFRNKEGFEYLLEKGADPNLRNDYGNAVMNHVAGDHEDSEWLRLALEHGGDPNLRWEFTGHPRAVGSTPLDDAVHSWNTTNIELLLEYGADINVIDDEKGYTPVVSACTGRAPHIAQWLLEHGADWTIQTTEGVGVAEAELAMIHDPTLFPIEAAAHEWILDFLEEKGVDLVAAEQRSREIYGPNFQAHRPVLRMYSWDQ